MDGTIIDRLPMSGDLRSCAAQNQKAGAFLQTFIAPFLSLAIRIWIASIFFRSGLQKLSDWDSTLYLFQDEYKVPVLSPSVAAILATSFELAMPVMLTIGLLTRISALPLLGMALVIQFVLGASNQAYDNVEHFYWMFLLGVLIVHGPGRFSIDDAIRRALATKSLD